ncbi:MAG: HAMP domain-containing sensor histidine kinase [Lachnospiraceae bacterium]|nr:HAMP domain-containing sensor histidine kinase [Lachnospiraceae bacterium]MEE3460865.1 HAMP domain-containing sensor histidine kinase [Lachnospiraceae bacterium]
MGDRSIVRLQRSFIFAASLAVLFILIIVILPINAMNFYRVYDHFEGAASIIAGTNGELPEKKKLNPENGGNIYYSEESRYETRYFSVIFDEDENELMTITNHIASVSSDKAADYGKHIMKGISSRHHRIGEKGMKKIGGNYYYYYVRTLDKKTDKEDLSAIKENIDTVTQTDSDPKYIIVFVDATSQMRSAGLTARMTLVTAACSLLLFILLLSLMSGKVVRPFINNMEKQRQFITNASHELKTPLTVISANTEVIEMMNGKNEWTESIIKQVKRMNNLISDLISLARDEETDKNLMENINLSDVAERQAADFKTVIENSGRTFDSDIAENITIKGEEKNISELFNILLDNAVKYCDEGGNIALSLKARGKGALITVSNSYADGEKQDYNRFFDRFYRADISHNNKKQGFGIGLSMAASIVKKHKGKITASWKNGVITFTIVF